MTRFNTPPIDWETRLGEECPRGASAHVHGLGLYTHGHTRYAGHYALICFATELVVLGHLPPDFRPSYAQWRFDRAVAKARAQADAGDAFWGPRF